MNNIIRFYQKGSIEIVHGQINHSFPLHSHESFCVGAIIEGNALVTIGNNICLLNESTIFIIPSNTGISISSNYQYTYITICFKNELRKYAENIKFNKYFIKINSPKEILLLCDNFKRDDDEYKFLNSIIKLIDNAIDYNSFTGKNQTNETVSLISEYIKKHAHEKFDLNKIAKSFYLSKYHLIRIFKKEMWVTPHQYYTQEKLRLIKSKIFISQSEVSLANNLNLSDESHLCKLFKKQMGISIKDYKKNLIKK